MGQQRQCEAAERSRRDAPRSVTMEQGVIQIGTAGNQAGGIAASTKLRLRRMSCSPDDFGGQPTTAGDKRIQKKRWAIKEQIGLENLIETFDENGLFPAVRFPCQVAAESWIEEGGVDLAAVALKLDAARKSRFV